MVFQNIHDERSRKNSSCSVIFQCAPVVFSAAFLTRWGELLLDVNNAINVLDIFWAELFFRWKAG